MSKDNFSPVRYRVTWIGKSVSNSLSSWPQMFNHRQGAAEDVARFLKQTSLFTRWDKCVVEGPTGTVVIKRKQSAQDILSGIKTRYTVKRKDGDCKGLYKPLADAVAAAGVSIK